MKELMSDEYELFRSYLIQHGKRFTQVREEILAQILQFNGEFAVKDILPLIKVQKTQINRASLYRNFKLLKLAGVIEEVPENESLCVGLFRVIKCEHRKYLLFCDGCHSKKEFFDDELDAVLLRICKENFLNPDSLSVKIEARHLRDHH